nr:MAG TPA: Thymidylate synthase complementing protein [Caudoviricetes sp.]
MKLIKQSFEFINQTDFSLVGIKKHIERCARVSYRSEDKITDTSYEKFVNMLESRGHDRPLEFGTVHLKMPEPEFRSLIDILTSSRTYNDLWIHYKIVETWEEGYTIYVTTNYRYYKLMWNQMNTLSEYFDKTDSEYYPKRYTVHMILDRGVMDEFRTHVGLSHLAESTRYCNYSKDKFGNELTFIKPCWLNVPEGKYNHCIMVSKNSPDIKIECVGSDEIGKYYNIGEDEGIFLNGLIQSELTYLNLINNKKWTPQQARSVLPLGIKSELISCGFEDAWENFFKRRDAPDAHPMAQEIANPMHKEFFKLTRAS